LNDHPLSRRKGSEGTGSLFSVEGDKAAVLTCPQSLVQG
jgi:hypothetical protein